MPPDERTSGGAAAGSSQRDDAEADGCFVLVFAGLLMLAVAVLVGAWLAATDATGVMR